MWSLDVMSGQQTTKTLSLIGRNLDQDQADLWAALYISLKERWRRRIELKRRLSFQAKPDLISTTSSKLVK